MRRTLVLVLLGALALIGTPAHARYGTPRLDTWLKYDHSVVGKDQVNVRPIPRLRLKMSPGTRKVVRWRIENVKWANEISMRGCQGDAEIALRYFTPSGDPISRKVKHGPYSIRLDGGSATTIRVRVHARHRNSTLRCVLRARSGGAQNGRADRVILKVRT